jgi:hypothetical protein
MQVLFLFRNFEMYKIRLVGVKVVSPNRCFSPDYSAVCGEKYGMALPLKNLNPSKIHIFRNNMVAVRNQI